MRKMLTGLGMGGVGVAVACVALGCGRGDGQPAARKGMEREAVEVKLAPVVRRTVDRSIDITGTLYGEEEATIAAKVGGRVAELRVDVGDEAPSGSELAVIDRTDYELAAAERRSATLAALAKLGLTSMPGEELDLSKVPTVERSRAEEANARARLARAGQLFEQSPPLISEQDFADIQTQWEVAARSADVELLLARSALAEARTQAAMAAGAEQRLADTLVLAPRPSGRNLRYRVAQRMASIGELVADGQPLFRLVASDVIKFRGAVPERYMGKVAPGQRATLKVEAFPETFAGEVRRVSPRIEPRTRSFEVEIEVSNAEGRLKAGAYGRASVVVGVEEDVPFVPASAVVTFAGVEKVFGVRDGKAVEHRVRTGASVGGMVEIVGGSGGSGGAGGFEAEEVVVSGATALAADAPVRVMTVAGQP